MRNASKALIALTVLLSAGSVFGSPHFELPRSGFGPADLGVVVNDDDPLSVRVGEYYRSRRRIPAENMIHVRLPVDGTTLSPEEFLRVKAEVDARTPPRVQAFALTWAQPYRVGCMSITTAFAVGFDEAYCADACKPTKASPYFDSDSRTPYADFDLRPTMTLAGIDFDEVKALIDRGVASDRTLPDGTGYLVSTTDAARNVRARDFPDAVARLGRLVRLELVRGDYIEGRRDVLFYFTGTADVPSLYTNRFLPGAIADHLTSAGGKLTDGWTQMSSLRWLEAGATASYGAVQEPCNFPAKFPVPAIVIRRYATGESLIEAYWKSVAWPGQGVFVGEPLANPFGGHSVTVEGDRATIRTRSLKPGRYALLWARSPAGPYTPAVLGIPLRLGENELKLEGLKEPFYRLVRMAAPQHLRSNDPLP